MEKKLWFKAKTYGWGWTPSSWEGWLATLVYVVAETGLVIWFIKKIEFLQAQVNPEYTSSIIIFIAGVLILISALITLCIKRGEKPSWHWGDK